MAIDVKKIEVIQAAKAPQNVKELNRFVGQVKWHARYIKYLANVCTPLTHLTKEDVSFVWDTPQEKAFQLLKKMLSVALVLQPPDWSSPFHVFVDASDVAIGAVLMQEKEKGWHRPVYYASQMLTATEKNYSVIER